MFKFVFAVFYGQTILFGSPVSQYSNGTIYANKIHSAYIKASCYILLLLLDNDVLGFFYKKMF